MAKLSVDNKVAIALGILGAIVALAAAVIQVVFSGNQPSPDPSTVIVTPQTNPTPRDSAPPIPAGRGPVAIAPVPQASAPSLDPDTTANNNSQTNISGSGPWPEISEWSANIFDSPGMSAVIGRTVAGKVYSVVCRIAPSPEQPSSVSRGGWYHLASGGYVAANTFNNGPLPNNNPYDPSVAVCSG